MRPLCARSLGCLAFALLAACGGGESATPSGSTSQVTGKVTSRNGLPANLDGVQVTCPETGRTAATATDGSFRIDVPDGAPFRVEFDDPTAFGVVDGVGAVDCDERADPDADRDDLRNDGVRIDALAAGESCDLEVAIVDGTVVAYRLSRGGQSTSERLGEGWLFPMLPDSSLLGEIEVTQEGDCWVLEVEVDCAIDSLGTYTVEVVLPDGTTKTLGTVSMTADGGHVRFEVCPEDVEIRHEDLAGAVVQIVDAEGTVVLSGIVPDLDSENAWEFPYGHGTDGWDGGDGTWDWDNLPDPDDLRDLLDRLPFDLPADFPFGR